MRKYRRITTGPIRLASNGNGASYGTRTSVTGETAYFRMDIYSGVPYIY